MQTRQQFQRARLLADGRKGLEMRRQGATIEQILGATNRPGDANSQARIYRAMSIARKSIDPLME